MQCNYRCDPPHDTYKTFTDHVSHCIYLWRKGNEVLAYCSNKMASRRSNIDGGSQQACQKRNVDNCLPVNAASGPLRRHTASHNQSVTATMDQSDCDSNPWLRSPDSVHSKSSVPNWVHIDCSTVSITPMNLAPSAGWTLINREHMTQRLTEQWKLTKTTL